MIMLILGEPDDHQAACVHHKLTERGHTPLFLDTRDFPQTLRLANTFGPGIDTLGSLTFPDGARCALDEVHAVYWRTHQGFLTPPVEHHYEAVMAEREIESAIGGLFRLMPCRWVNPADAIDMHVFKGYQLHKMHEAGIPIPKTLISNDPEAVRAFYDALDAQVIYKPVRGGAHTEPLTAEDLSNARLAELAKAPVQFQERIEGTDIRVYWVDGEIFAAEIQSRTLDFRDDPGAPIVPITLPQAVAEQVATVAGLMGLVFSGIDIRRTPEGEHIFLEANPSPMFIYFEQQSGYPVSDTLVDLLIRPHA